MIYIFGIVINQILIIIFLYGLLKIISYYQTLYNKKVTTDSPIEYIMTFIDKYHVKNKFKQTTQHDETLSNDS